MLVHREGLSLAVLITERDLSQYSDSERAEQEAEIKDMPNCCTLHDTFLHLEQRVSALVSSIKAVHAAQRDGTGVVISRCSFWA